MNSRSSTRFASTRLPGIQKMVHRRAFLSLLAFSLCVSATTSLSARDSPLSNSVRPATGPSGASIPDNPKTFRFWDSANARLLGDCRAVEQGGLLVAEAQGPSRLLWTIVDSADRPIPNVEIKVALAKAASSEQFEKRHGCVSLLSNESGTAQFSVLKPGRNYVVEFHAPEYEPVAVTLLGAARTIRENSHVIRMDSSSGDNTPRRITLVPDRP